MNTTSSNKQRRIFVPLRLEKQVPVCNNSNIKISQIECRVDCHWTELNCISTKSSKIIELTISGHNYSRLRSSINSSNKFIRRIFSITSLHIMKKSSAATSRLTELGLQNSLCSSKFRDLLPVFHPWVAVQEPLLP